VVRVQRQRGGWAAREQLTWLRRESLRRSDDFDAANLGCACFAMSSTDTLRSVGSVPALRRGCVVSDTSYSAAIAACAKQKRVGQQLYVGQAAWLCSEYLTGESMLSERVCRARANARAGALRVRMQM
jgi:hypothetical protein